ncbi:YkoF family thiamine/hydroxymethylpyrimidine-binding protein [Simiduia agarivorans]|uniref:Thiamin/hydroxymethyl pyrimidine-binding YkoF putative domain-containing protein n=1 Tax=Simiduia agarivorans (strain DSM 21679 / JCM 13881 / BCRC 17597 / SA1) TaxID=1117647 RepID=K4KMS1_SIMAS|nr:YkoF family thiamine/hydroxymethylpyrimidine-binding protein [Simiduia agarivorans]AFV00317.1 hypothetical protein M5M_15920 [Simiduia agarivorans SA1 = DSM 21679]
MQLTAEISLYPLRDDYIEPIKWFIGRLDQYPGITRVTNAMATQVSGDYDAVMQMLGVEMKAAHERFGRAVFVCKFINGALDLSHRQ